MTTAAERKRAKRARRPIYVIVRRLVDPDTGEAVGAMVPASAMDQRLMRERKFNVGREIRAELKQSRNPQFHRLAHALGALLVDNLDGFEGTDSHAALKRVQAESGVCCERDKFVLDLGSLGRHEVERCVPRSIAFDEMDESEFGKFFSGVCDWIDKHYMTGLTDDVRGEYLLMTEGTERRAA